MQQTQSPRFVAFLRAAAIGLLMAGACIPVRAEEPRTSKPLALREIMRELDENMQAITGAISREEWQQVSTIAPRIVDHRQPPTTEKIRILAYLGKDAGSFRDRDRAVGEAARALEQAAVSGDGESVISSFAKLQAGCLDCHQSFRKPFLDHFYGDR